MKKLAAVILLSIVGISAQSEPSKEQKAAAYLKAQEVFKVSKDLSEARTVRDECLDKSILSNLKQPSGQSIPTALLIGLALKECKTQVEAVTVKAYRLAMTLPTEMLAEDFPGPADMPIAARVYMKTLLEVDEFSKVVINGMIDYRKGLQAEGFPQ